MKTLKEITDKLLLKYPDKCPCIVMYDEKIFIKNNKIKYLVPKDITFGQFNYTIRSNVNIHYKQTLFIFVKDTLIPSSQLFSDVYDKYKDNNGILFCTANLENTFG